MKTLTIEHLKGYLGTDLQIARMTQNNIYKRVEYELNGKNIDEVIQYENLKPLLYPLSTLTEFREDLGFVPMLKLLELQETNYFDPNINVKVKFNEKCIISCEHKKYELTKKEDFIVKYATINGQGDTVYSFTYDPQLRRFIFRDEILRKPLGIAYQLDMFEKLYEWHIDIHGLIEQGLAIDKTKI